MVTWGDPGLSRFKFNKKRSLPLALIPNKSKRIGRPYIKRIRVIRNTTEAATSFRQCLQELRAWDRNSRGH